MREIEISFSEFKLKQEQTHEYLSVILEKELNIFQKLFDSQQNLFYNYLTATKDIYYVREENERVVIHAYLKSMHLIYTASQLILRGDFGAAKILMRQIFEYLIIGKYVFTKQLNAESEKWLKRRQFDVYDKVIKLLKVPDKRNFLDFWIILSNQAHAGSSSLQIGLDEEQNLPELILIFQLNMMFLCFTSHLLLKCFINSKLEHIVETYSFRKVENKQLRIKLKKAENMVIALLSDSGIDLIKDYKRSWIFKNKSNIIRNP